MMLLRRASAGRLRQWHDRHPGLAAVLIASAIFVASLCIIAPGSYREINVYDEGVSAYGAERAASGEIPYRDFWTIYAPGDLYFLAALFKLFGTQLIVERHAWVLLEAVLALLVFAIARRLGNRVWAVLCWGLLAVWTRQVPFFGSPLIPALVCCVGAILATLSVLDRPQAGSQSHSHSQLQSRPLPRTRMIVLAGVLVGICTLFRQDFGIYTFVAIAATLVLASRALKPLLLFAAATVITLAPAVLALLIVVPPHLLYDHFVVFPLRTYPQTRALPLPPLPGNPFDILTSDITIVGYLKAHARSWQFYSSLILLSGAMARSLFSLRQRRDAFLIAAMGLLMLNQARIRSDVFHLYPAFIFTLLAVASMMSTASRWRVRWPYYALTALATIFIVTIAALAFRSERAAELRQSPFATERASGLSTLHGSHAYEEAIAFVQRIVPPGEPIFVGNNRHDHIVANDVMFYFLSARHSATRYHDMHPGVVTTARVQDEIVRELDRQQVSCIVRWDDVSHVWGPVNDNSTPSAVTTLDRYIEEHFEAGPRFEEYQIWQRRTNHAQ
jgi:hypothetical protein